MNKEEFFKGILGKPDRIVGAVVRPRRDAQLIKEDFGIGSVIAQTRGDNGASGLVMIDKDFKPTGVPAADPPGAHCLICRKRIWVHDDDTAFPIQVSFHGDWQEVAGGACCEKCSKIDDDQIQTMLEKRARKEG